MGHIFISHHPNDENYAHILADHLEREGFKVLLNDPRDSPGRLSKNQQLLDISDALVLVVSRSLLDSKWVENLIQWAKHKNKPIFSLLMEGNDHLISLPRLSVERFPHFYVTGSGMPEAGFYDQLSRTVRQKIPTTAAEEILPEEPKASKIWVPNRGTEKKIDGNTLKGCGLDEASKPAIDNHRIKAEPAEDASGPAIDYHPLAAEPAEDASGPAIDYHPLAAEPLEEASKPAEEKKKSPRYANYDLFHVKDDSYDIKDYSEVGSKDALRKGNWYELEAWIASTPEGKPIENEKGERQPIRDPNNNEPALIYVWFQVDPEDFDFDERDQLQVINLPPAGQEVPKEDLKKASFRVCPRKISPSEREFASIGVHFYYNFNAIEKIEIKAEVVEEDADQPKSYFGLSKPIKATYIKLGDWIQLEDVPRQEMQIIVDSFKSDTFQLTFLYGGLKEYKGALRLAREELEDSIIKIRKILTDLAVDENSPIKQRHPYDLMVQVMELTKRGRILWEKLFESEKNKSLWYIGQFLKRFPVEEEGSIQVTIHPDAAGFVFPWNLLYDRDEPDIGDKLEDVLKGFWGYRYRVEQVLSDKMNKDTPNNIIKLEDRLMVSFMLDADLDEATPHEQFITNLAESSHQKISVIGPIINNGECVNLLKNSDSHIIYFYSKGNTRSIQADIAYVEDPDKLEESFIELSEGTVKLDDLELNKNSIDLRKGAVVILNMCESAQITPSLSEGFVPFFIEMGAGAVVGTECPINTFFAKPFAEALFNSFLSGKSLGVALLAARRRFLQPGELMAPLGLIYTLYGYGTLNYAPPPLVD